MRSASTRGRTKLYGPDTGPSAGIKNSVERPTLSSGREKQVVVLAQQEEVVLQIWLLVSTMECGFTTMASAYQDAHSLSTLKLLAGEVVNEGGSVS